MIKSKSTGFPRNVLPAPLTLDGPSGQAVSNVSVIAAHGCPEREMVLLDARMVRLFEKASAIAAGNISVLIIGETGTGKELLAEAIHRNSGRARQTFLRLNCAALAETLLESELFGHERGSFTGAFRAMPGLLETARGGTVFLDEVAEMPASLQAKLLRVIEVGEVLRVGGRRPETVDLRFVSATNRELDTKTSHAGLRGDLFYRLSGAVLRVPPLRERRCEIPEMARLFLTRATRLSGRAPMRLSTAALGWMMEHPWPGNVRELRNLMERVALLCRGAEIDLQDLVDESSPFPPTSTPGKDAPSASRASGTGAERTARAADAPTERARIMSALEDCGGNQTRAAHLLGISRATLVRRISSLGLPRPRKRNRQDG